MTTVLGKFNKQPHEILDYDVDYSEWFAERTDTPDSFVVLVDDPALEIVGSSRTGNVIKIILSDGIDGTKYKVTVRLTTLAGLVKEADFTVNVKEI